MKKSLILFIFIFSLSCVAEMPLPQAIVSVVTDPEKYNGKHIRLIGAVEIESTLGLICPYMEDLKYGLPHNCIGLTFSKEQVDKAKQLSWKYMSIEGTYNANISGNVGEHGELENITLFFEWQKRDRDAERKQMEAFKNRIRRTQENLEYRKQNK